MMTLRMSVLRYVPIEGGVYCGRYLYVGTEDEGWGIIDAGKGHWVM
jgi:hypothetical protein